MSNTSIIRSCRADTATLLAKATVCPIVLYMSAAVFPSALAVISVAVNSRMFTFPLAVSAASCAMLAPALLPNTVIASDAVMPASAIFSTMSINVFCSGLISATVMPYFFRAVSCCSVPFAAAIIAMRKFVPARLPSRPRSRNAATLAVVCSSVIPNDAPAVPANFMASRTLEKSSSDFRMARLKTLVILSLSAASSPN